MKSNVKIILFYVILIVGILLLTTLLFNGMNKADVQYSDVIDAFEKGEVTTFKLDTNNNINLTLKGGKTIEYRLRDLGLFWTQVGDLIDEQNANGTIQNYDIEEPVDAPWWLSFLPYVIVIVVFVLLWMYVMNQATGGKGSKINAFGRARTKLGSEEKKKVYFTDVAGADEEKEELSEVVEFLKNPAKYQELGAKIPRGILLVGPPGTGKTLLAKAVAGEAGVPFYSISGSDFVEMYVGVGASRVRDLFETAKKSSPCIVFIDEIDAVGRHRGAGLGGGHDEREQTLNQLLVEMDGFGSNDGVIIIAATNRPDILDPALLRPGRFDREITVNYPDIRGREEILKVHAKGKPLEKTVDLSMLAKNTAGFTGADLANLLNEAALLAARKGKKLIGMPELEDATIKVLVGPKKKSRVVTEKERRLTAYHEAGHAIVTNLLDTQDPVYQISIIPSGRAGGYTLSPPREDKSYMSKQEMEEEIVSLLGGRVAEKLVLSDVSTGASNDIQRASEIARKMITSYGMSDRLGPIVYGTGQSEVFLGRDFGQQRNYSEKIAGMIDDEVMTIVSGAYTRAQELLESHMEKLHFVASYLLQNEVMDEDQFALAMQDNVTFEDLDKIRDKKQAKSENENQSRAQDNARRAREAASQLPPQEVYPPIAPAPMKEPKETPHDKEDDTKKD